jgi:hypothetical protein
MKLSKIGGRLVARLKKKKEKRKEEEKKKVCKFVLFVYFVFVV